ncbi:MAG TPA: nitroreductase/quinone reductase family protein [Polyangiaceae bacterium]|jgi:deazaflavin-dependent oxidoreductase (nitroreductase family)
MSFTTPDGTRGARQPSGRFLRWMNKWMNGRIRKTGKAAFMKFDALVLTTVGRKSGLERTTPVGFFPGKDGTWLIVASAAGAAKNPDWYHNLGAHPDKVQIETGGKKVAVVAEQLEGAEREEAWKQITAASAQFAKYQQQTDRVLPVIRLRPREG